MVEDIEVARAELTQRGAKVSELFHYEGIRGPTLPGPDPERGSYRSYATFSDPDGNGWVLQEIHERLPGRGLSVDVPSLTDLLKETEEHHGKYSATRRAPLVEVVRRLRRRARAGADTRAGRARRGSPPQGSLLTRSSYLPELTLRRSVPMRDARLRPRARARLYRSPASGGGRTRDPEGGAPGR